MEFCALAIRYKHRIWLIQTKIKRNNLWGRELEPGVTIMQNKDHGKSLPNNNNNKKESAVKLQKSAV